MSFPPPRHAGMQTDLYELTMAAAYWTSGKAEEVATFELSIRSLPPQRSFLLCAGLEQAVEYFDSLSYSDQEIEFLRKHPLFRSVPAGFFDYLAGLRFTGDLWAVPEGTVVFAEEPLLRVTAPMIQAQIAETYLLSMLTYQTNVASKAARLNQVAGGRGVVEFGSRRAHGPQAGLLAARASYIGGCLGTSNVLAGYELGIPIFGTTAHSWTMSFEEEEEAFSRFAEVFGSDSVLLIDTFDSLEAVRKALRLNLPFRGVRLDSGDLAVQSHEVRKLLDEGGRADALIFASGDLNEYVIRDLLEQGAPLDLFGVGTELVTSRDAPALGGIYKLVQIDRDGETWYTAKFSQSKTTYPGKKQVFRFSDASAFWTHDVIGLADEIVPDAEPLLQPVMTGGKLLADLPALEEIRSRAADHMTHLPDHLCKLEPGEMYRVEKSAALEKMLETVRNHYLLQPAGSGTPDPAG